MLRLLASSAFWILLSYLALVLQLSFPQIPIIWWVILLVAFTERFHFVLALIFWSLLSWLLASLSSLSWLWWWLPVTLMLFIKPWVTRRFLLNQSLQRGFGLLGLSLSHRLALEVWAGFHGGVDNLFWTGFLEILLTFFLGMVLLTVGPELKAWLVGYLPKGRKPIREFSWMGEKDFSLKKSSRSRKPFGLD